MSTASATRTLHRANSNRWVKGAARIGLAGRGIMYLIIAYLAIKVATARSARPADRNGALQTIAQRPLGHALLALLAVGYGGYAIWRFAEAVAGHRCEADTKKRRAKRLASATKSAIYAAFCVTTAALSVGRRAGNSDAKSAPWTARLMKLPFGRGLVAAVGVGIVAAGGYLVVRGVRTKFQEELDTGQMHPTTQKVVVGLGLLGNVARGTVTAIAGLFLVKAASDFNPAEARGLDGTLRTIAARPYGAMLLIVASLGLLAFGLYSFCEARYSSM